MEHALRVAAYCRVSTDKEDQLHSLAAQQAYFEGYIARHGWRCAGIFADEGLSGTTLRRPRFAELLRLARSGAVDLILTKEVSRFARNTVDALQVTRRLREQGVGVIFLSDGIDTRDNDGEFRLTIMASVAQEESRKISERTRWGQLQAMRRGVAFGNDTVYGYALRGGALTIRPEQAEVVREVYRKCLEEGKGAHTIARELTEAGVAPPLRADGAWSPAMILRLLHNEKYCGDLLQKKYRTVDHLTHRKVVNHGAEEQFRLENHHPAIVSRAQFAAVQAELARRAGLAGERSRFSARYWYSGKLVCGACGGRLTAKRTRRPDGREYLRFVCRGRGTGCAMRAVPGDVLTACVRHVLGEVGLPLGAMAAEVLASARPAGAECGAAALRQALRRQEARRARALDAFLDGTLSREELAALTARSEAERSRLARRLADLEMAGAERPERRAALLDWLAGELAGGEAVLDAAVKRVTVQADALLVELEELPLCFRVRAQAGGRGAARRVEVTECTPLPR